MAWKRLTFVLIPHSQDKIKQIRVHKIVIYGLVSFLVVATIVMILYIIGFKGKEFNLRRTASLTESNSILEKQLAVFDSSLTTLDGRIAYLESLNTAIIEESGISEMDLERFADPSAVVDIKDPRIVPERILTIINRLDKQSQAFDYNFTSLFDICSENDEFLRRVPSIRPARGTITREFGRSRDVLPTTGQKAHQGVDITWEEGTPVVATADGVVEESNTTKELGKYIIIDHENGYKTRYAHLQLLAQMKDKIRIKAGDRVVRGQQIGTIGRTGISITATPSHIMYSVYHHGVPVNPVDYFFASDRIAYADRAEITGGPSQALLPE